MTWSNAIGFVAFALTITGNILLARKHKAGWLFRQLSTVGWGTYALTIVSLPLIANTFVYFGLNLYGYLNWRRLERLDSDVEA